MSEYAYSFDDLRGDILGVMQSMGAAHAAQQKLDEAMAADLVRLWADNAALRDELHALANRVETLTRARLTEPAETAEAMVARGTFPKDERLIPDTHRAVYGFHTEWRECSECGAVIYTGDDRLIHDAHGLHTCNADAANVRRMAKEYE